MKINAGRKRTCHRRAILNTCGVMKREDPPAHSRFVRIRAFCSLMGAAASSWSEDNAMRLSAALAYYSIFSMAPLLVFTISALGLIFGEDAARGRIADELRQFAGRGTAEAIQAIVLSVSRHAASYSAKALGLAVLIFGASGAFGELKDALNTIWGVHIKPGNTVKKVIRARVISFLVVFSVGLLLLVMVLVSAALAALGDSVRRFLALPPVVWHCADLALSLAISTLLFAMIFRILPNVLLRWRDVWFGALCAAILFTAGKFLIGFYLGTTGIATYYGAAGSVMVILLWVYYSACILFFGAELTKAWVVKHGTGIVPDKRAVLLRDPSEKAKP
jgi:membrane protein